MYLKLLALFPGSSPASCHTLYSVQQPGNEAGTNMASSSIENFSDRVLVSPKQCHCAHIGLSSQDCASIILQGLFHAERDGSSECAVYLLYL